MGRSMATLMSRRPFSQMASNCAFCTDGKEARQSRVASLRRSRLCIIPPIAKRTISTMPRGGGLHTSLAFTCPLRYHCPSMGSFHVHFRDTHLLFATIIFGEAFTLFSGLQHHLDQIDSDRIKILLQLEMKCRS